jgi:hypothetical protein
MVKAVHPRGRPLPPVSGIPLCEYNRAERSREIIVGTGSEEQPILGAIVSKAIAEVDSPKLVNPDRLASGVLDRAHELPSDGIEAVNSATVCVVRDQ